MEVPGPLNFRHGRSSPFVVCHVGEILVTEHHGHLNDAFQRMRRLCDSSRNVIQLRDVSAHELDVAAHALELIDESVISGADTGASREVDQLAHAVIDHPA